MTESEVQNQILHYLTVKGLFVWRNNNTPIFDPTRKTFRSMPKYSLKGIADILGISPVGGKLLAIELKKPVKNPRSIEKLEALLRPEQKEFARMVRQWGGIFVVCDSLESLKNQLYLHGIYL